MTLTVKRTVAAILEKSASNLVIEEIELPKELERGQVLVELISSGICGAQINEIDAVKGPDKFLPHLLGHEGYARVLQIDSSVKNVAPGDLVVMHWRPGVGIQANPAQYTWRRSRLNAGWVTTFNKHSVVSENRLTKLAHSNHDLSVIPLLGCALTTALGVLENDARGTFRDSLLIFGAGGVGLLLIKIAQLIGITDITVVDLHEEKLKQALKLGASNAIQFVNKEETLRQISKVLNHNLPTIAIDTSGNIDAIEICYEISSDNGRVVLVGVPRVGNKASIFTLPLHFGKILTGSHGGDSKPESDIPLLMELIAAGRLNLDDYPTQIFDFNSINLAIDRLRNGTSGRMIIDFNK